MSGQNSRRRAPAQPHRSSEVLGIPLARDSSNQQEPTGDTVPVVALPNQRSGDLDPAAGSIPGRKPKAQQPGGGFGQGQDLEVPSQGERLHRALPSWMVPSSTSKESPVPAAAPFSPALDGEQGSRAGGPVQPGQVEFASSFPGQSLSFEAWLPSSGVSGPQMKPVKGCALATQLQVRSAKTAVPCSITSAPPPHSRMPSLLGGLKAHPAESF